jgi:hypothetical protein
VTYLQLLQALHRECGAAGAAPSGVTNLTGEASRLAGYIRDANLDIQNLWLNWKFLWDQDSRALTPTSNVLAAPTGMGDGLWDEDTFKITPAGETVAQPLIVQEYDEVKSEDVDTTAGTPWRAVIMPDNSLRFEGTPDAADTFTADYFREPDADELTAAGDEPSIPSRFHQVIIGAALIKYATYEGAEEILTKGQGIYAEYLARLENSQLPNQSKARFRTGGHFTVRAE